MIIECPDCKASHSKTDRELANGASVTCRRCGKAFRLNPNGKTELLGEAASAATSSAAPFAVPAPVPVPVPVPVPSPAFVPAATPAASTAPAAKAPTKPTVKATPSSTASASAALDATLPHVAREAEHPTLSALDLADLTVPSPSGGLHPVAAPSSPVGPTPLPWAAAASAAAPTPAARKPSSTVSHHEAARAPAAVSSAKAAAPAAAPSSAPAPAPAAAPAAATPATTATAAEPAKARGNDEWSGQPTNLISVGALQAQLDRMRVGPEIESEEPAAPATEAKPNPDPTPPPTGALAGPAVEALEAQAAQAGHAAETAPSASPSAEESSRDVARFDCPSITPAATATARRSAPRPAFPSGSLRQAFRELSVWGKAQPLGIKLAAGGGAVALMTALVLLLVLMLSPARARPAYLVEAQALLAGPLAGEAYPQVASKQPGELVEIYGGFGEFSLVRDAMGRAGYLPTRALRDKAPAAVPGQAFVDCQRAPVESSIQRCQTRGQEQFDSCRAACTALPEEPACLGHCQKRFADCIAICDGSQPSPAALAGSAPAEPTPAAVPAPAEEPGDAEPGAAATGDAADKRKAPAKKAPSKRTKDKRGR